jgi:hypothetical protein
MAQDNSKTRKLGKNLSSFKKTQSQAVSTETQRLVSHTAVRYPVDMKPTVLILIT